MHLLLLHACLDRAAVHCDLDASSSVLEQPMRLPLDESKQEPSKRSCSEEHSGVVCLVWSLFWASLSDQSASPASNPSCLEHGFYSD
eukprot:4319689-Amphidinium_carterae.1